MFDQNLLGDFSRKRHQYQLNYFARKSALLFQGLICFLSFVRDFGCCILWSSKGIENCLIFLDCFLFISLMDFLCKKISFLWNDDSNLFTFHFSTHSYVISMYCLSQWWHQIDVSSNLCTFMLFAPWYTVNISELSHWSLTSVRNQQIVFVWNCLCKDL